MLKNKIVIKSVVKVLSINHFSYWRQLQISTHIYVSRATPLHAKLYIPHISTTSCTHKINITRTQVGRNPVDYPCDLLLLRMESSLDAGEWEAAWWLWFVNERVSPIDGGLLGFMVLWRRLLESMSGGAAAWWGKERKWGTSQLSLMSISQ